MPETTKIYLNKILNPYIQKHEVDLPGGEKILVGIFPITDAFQDAQVEAIQEIQEALGMTEKEYDEYEERRMQRYAKFKQEVDDGKTEEEAWLNTENEDIDRKFTREWNRRIVPLQIVHMVVDPESGESLFTREDAMRLPRKLRIFLTQLCSERIRDENLGIEESKK